MDNPLSLYGRRYLVTGAASGMGYETALYLSRLGADLLLLDINESLLIKTQSEYKTKCSILVADLSRLDFLSKLVGQDVLVHGKLNGLVHCAGLPYVAPLKVISKDKTERVMTINSLSALELCKIFTNRRNYAGIHGSIVLISSVYGLVGSAANAAYAMSKGAVQSLTKALSIELAPKGIRVNCIAPCFVKTPMAGQVNHNFEPQYEEQIERLHPMG